MLFKSLLLSSALAVSSVVAQTTSLNATITSTTSIAVSSGCSFSKTLTATAQSDLDALTSCDAIKGDILIQGSAFSNAQIASVKAIYGDLTIFNATELDTFTASDLTTITGTFTLKELTILQTLNLQALNQVGAINFVTLPALTSINFASSSITDAESIYITDTQLESLDGFDVTNVQVFNVNNNKNLNKIDSALQSVSSALEVSYNSKDLEASFDDLIWANNITLRDISSISFSNLTNVNASFGVLNTEIDTLDVDTLTAVGGTFIISENDRLSDLSFTKLQSVGGGFVIANNTDLNNITEFGSLKTIGGAVIISGDIDEASFKSLKTVKGGFSIESDGDLDCKSFNKLQKSGVVQGDKYVCKGASTSVSSSVSKTSSASDSSSSSSATSSADSSTSGSSSSSSSKSKSGAATTNGASIFATIAGLLLALL